MTSEDPDLRPDVPHGARIWNYWLGGKDNFAADREIGEAVRAQYPAMPEYARRSREFLSRAVRHLAHSGVRQFLDVGTGLPTMDNTHEVAQAVAPDARVVYVDNDPLVLAHARALLRGSDEGATVYVDADYRDTATIVERAGRTLDLGRPVAVLCMGVFGYLETAADAAAVVAGLMAPMPSGSHLALWDGTDTSEEARAGAQAQADMGSPYRLRTVTEIESWFDGLDLLDPGVVPVTRWRADGDTPPIDAYGGVARKP